MDPSPMSLALLAVAAFLLVMEIRACRAEMSKPEPEQPSCFGEYAFRHPHITAERDCRNCPFLFDCHEDSPFEHDKGDLP